MVLEYGFVDGIVGGGFELAPPAVELEVEKAVVSVFKDGDEAIVSNPGVVESAGKESDVLKSLLRQFLLEKISKTVGVGACNQKPLDSTNLVCYAEVAFCDVLNPRFPIGVFIGPCYLDSVLWKPFGRHTIANTLGVGHRESLLQCGLDARPPCNISDDWCLFPVE